LWRRSSSTAVCAVETTLVALGRSGPTPTQPQLTFQGSSACPASRGQVVDNVAPAVVDLSAVRDTTGLTAGIHADGHGWELLSGTTREWAPLAATVAAFIRRHAGRRSRPGQ
jgi:hypothetical protein